MNINTSKMTDGDGALSPVTSAVIEPDDVLMRHKEGNSFLENKEKKVE